MDNAFIAATCLPHRRSTNKALRRIEKRVLHRQSQRINQTQDRLATEFTALDLRLQEIERMLRTAAEPRPRRRPKKADA